MTVGMTNAASTASSPTVTIVSISVNPRRAELRALSIVNLGVRPAWPGGTSRPQRSHVSKPRRKAFRRVADGPGLMDDAGWTSFRASPEDSCDLRNAWRGRCRRQVFPHVLGGSHADQRR